MNELLLFEKKGNVEWITFNNPSKANCLSREMLRGLIKRLEALKTEKEVRTVVFTGSGEKSFSAGMDVKEFIGLNPQTSYELISELKEFCELVRKIPQVVIVAINGYCIGAAMELSMAADIRIASKEAVFIMPEVKLGIPSVLDSVLLQKHVGLGLAKEMLLLGEPIAAERINKYGFLNSIVDPHELNATVEVYVEKVSEVDFTTIQQQKNLFEMWQNSSLDVAIQDSMNQFALSFATGIPQTRIENLEIVKKITIKK